MVWTVAALLSLGGFLWRPASAQQDAAADFQNIVVKPGDTLWSVSQQYLKDPKKWDEVLRYNTLPSNDPTVALPGMTLRVPVKSIKEELQAARLVYRMNQVYYRRKEGGQWLGAAENMEVFRNDTIKTMKDSKAGVRFLDNDLMQIDPDSIAIVMPTAKDYAVELKRGGIVASNKKVRLGSATVSPASPDTVFTASVRDDHSTVVQVYKGAASVEAAGKTVKVGAGKATEIKAGLAPSLPFEIPDLPGLGSILSGFQSQLASLKKRLGKAPALPPVQSAAPAEVPKAGSETADLMKEAAAIKILEPVMGYRIECSRTEDFQYLVAQRFYDDETPMRPEDFAIPRSKYWCRMAPVDLLGKTGKFKDPKLYVLGGGAP